MKSGDKAVGVVALGHDDHSGASVAYFVRGQARGLSRNFVGADEDLETAERHEQKALIDAEGEFLRAEYLQTLKNKLLFPFTSFVCYGKKEAAQAKAQQAAQL